MRAEGGRLKISRDCSTNPTLISDIQNNLLACWEIYRFTESRWQTIGKSSRALVIGFLTGLNGFVDFILDEAGGSSWYLGGLRRLKED